MGWLDIFKKGGAVEKAIEIVDKAVVDKDKAKELKLDIIKIMASQQSPITRYVRAALAIMFMTVWLWFPEKNRICFLIRRQYLQAGKKTHIRLECHSIVFRSPFCLLL